MEERIFILVLVVLNLAVGMGGAVFLAGVLGRAEGQSRRRVRFFGACLIAYFLECVAFAAGMATQVFALALAVVWGVLVGLWLRRAASVGRPWRILISVGLYTSSPTLTFCFLLPLACSWSGLEIISPQAGLQFGIPDFVPAAFQTILGFCLVLGLMTLFLKCGVTTATASWALRRNRREANQDVHATLQ